MLRTLQKMLFQGGRRFRRLSRGNRRGRGGPRGRKEAGLRSSRLDSTPRRVRGARDCTEHGGLAPINCFRLVVIGRPAQIWRNLRADINGEFKQAVCDDERSGAVFICPTRIRLW